MELTEGIIDARGGNALAHLIPTPEGGFKLQIFGRELPPDDSTEPPSSDEDQES